MATTPTKETKELRRWCVDAAMRWPFVSAYDGQFQQSFNYVQPAEADIISRAKKIEAYVLGRTA